jgi:hypothetical protein
VTTPVNNPTAHLYCYSDDTEMPPNTTLSVDNQFGTGALVVGASTRLCLPSWKFDDSISGSSNPLAIAGSVSPSAWTDPATLGLDHYQCYSVTLAGGSGGQFVNQPATVGLMDQFANDPSVKVGTPEELCTPVIKSIDGSASPPSALFGGGLNGDMLVCYAVATGVPHPFPQVGNQFSQSPPGAPGTKPAPVPVSVGPADQLCLPSTATLPGTDTPEVPAALLLPVAGIAIFGGAWGIRRQRGGRRTIPA